MERRVFEAALRAAAKITVGTSLLSTVGRGLVGCGGLVTIQRDEGETEGEVGGEAPSEPAVQGGFAASDGGSTPGDGGSGGEVAVCDQPAEPPGGFGTFDEPTFDCCVSRIDALAPDTMPEGFDEDVAACCTQILSENYAAIWAQEPLVHDAPQGVIDACCIFKHGNVACTPWGPPVPIAMDPADYVPWVMDALGEHPVPFGSVA